MLDDDSYKNDEKLISDIRNMNYPIALADFYEFIEKIYEKEVEDRKKS